MNPLRILLTLAAAQLFAAAALAMTPDDLTLTRSVALRGNAPAQVLLAIAYLHGDGGLPVDEKLAAYWFEQAALQGNVYAERHLGDLYAEGRGTQRNPTLAIDWYQRAAKRDDVDAQLKLGRIYMDGIGVPADSAKAGQWLEKAATGGSSEAAYRLSELYRHDTASQDEKAQADYWLHHSASLGYPPAEALWQLIEGFGQSFHTFDRTLSPAALRKLATDGDAEAQYQLALRLEAGSGGMSRDVAQSIEWFRRAAGQDHVMAMKSLAQIYAVGVGSVAADPAAAVYWRTKAEQAAH